MREERLMEWIRQADGDRRENVSLDVVRIRAESYRRRRRQRVIMPLLLVMGVAALAAGVSLLPARRPATMPEVVRDETPLDVRSRIAVEAQVLLDRRRAENRRRLASEVHLPSLQEESALQMVLIAQRRAVVAGPLEAADVYRRTIAMFPDTPSAQTARNALKTLPGQVN